MPWQAPKTNWTSSDYYNFADLNRVESNSVFLAEKLGEYFSKTITLNGVTTNRTMERIEFNDQLNRIEGNIAILASNFYKPVGWKEVKTTWSANQPFDYTDANRLENNLFLIYTLLMDAINNYKYAGTFMAGEGVL